MKKKTNKSRQNFLLSFFDEKGGYAEQNVNDFWLVKHWNGNTQEFQVAIYTEESFRNYKAMADERQQLSLDWIK